MSSALSASHLDSTKPWTLYWGFFPTPTGCVVRFFLCTRRDMSCGPWRQQRSRLGPADIWAERHHQRTRAGGSAGTPAPPQQLHGSTAPRSSHRGGDGRQRRGPLGKRPCLFTRNSTRLHLWSRMNHFGGLLLFFGGPGVIVIIDVCSPWTCSAC